jgi:GMP synthase (glutamine-hydrolysing)
MLVYVDLEHERLQQIDPKLWRCSRVALAQVKERLERLGQRPCLTLPYHAITPERLESEGVEAVFVSGCTLSYDYYTEESLAGLRRVYREWERPLLGICAGMQLMAQAHGATIGPLAAIPPDVANLHLATTQNINGMAQEIGFQSVTITQAHPLFATLEECATFYQAHYWEVKEVPPGFEVLAQSGRCPIQAIAHRERPLFGVQFHPEKYDEEHRDGRQHLQNFLEIVGMKIERG